MSREDLVIDNDLAVFAREELVTSIKKESLRPYPKLKISSGQIMPVVVRPDLAWKSEIEIWEYSPWGIAQVLSGAANDGGRVGIIANKMSYKIRTISDYTLIPWTEIQQAAANNTPLSSYYAQSLRYGMDKKLNSIGYDGDVNYGLQGLFTSQILRLNSATTLAGASNPDAMLALLNSWVSVCVTNSNGLWLPKVLVLPLAQWQLIWNTPRASGTDLTVAEAFLNAQSKMGQIERIEWDNTLIGKGETGDAALILPFENQGLNSDNIQDENYNPGDELAQPIYFALPLDFTIPSEFQQWEDTQYRERAITRCGGTVVTDPFSGLIVSNV